ncbi:hypothetical protein ACFX2A_001562 [Malus domestica]
MVMSHHKCLLSTKVIKEANKVIDEVENGVGGRVERGVSVAIASHVRSNNMVAMLSQETDLVAPRIPYFPGSHGGEAPYITFRVLSRKKTIWEKRSTMQALQVLVFSYKSPQRASPPLANDADPLEINLCQPHNGQRFRLQ